MDTAHQWHQELGLVKPDMTMMMMTSSSTTTASAAAAASNICTANRPPPVAERRARPQKEQALNCPRCNSANTKFCYYNNYSLTQPRYFCKTCRRYWTEGGSLRNVPVGGGSRKNKRSSSSASASSSSSTITVGAASTAAMTSNPKLKLATDHHHHLITKFHDGQDLNLAFPGLPEFNDFPNLDNTAGVNGDGSNAVGALSAMELLRSGLTARGIGAAFPPMPPPPPAPLPEYPTGFGLQEFRSPALSFPMDGISGGGGGGEGESSGDHYGTLQGVQDTAGGGAGRLLFPFDDVKPAAAAEFDVSSRSHNGHPPAFWNAMMSGGRGSW